MSLTKDTQTPVPAETFTKDDTVEKESGDPNADSDDVSTETSVKGNNGLNELYSILSVNFFNELIIFHF